MEEAGVFEGVFESPSDTISIGVKNDFLIEGNPSDSAGTQLLSRDLARLIHSNRSRFMGVNTLWSPRCRYRLR